MSTIADDLREAAEAVMDLQRLRHGTHIGCAKCEEKWRFATRLRQHADTIERVEREMDGYIVTPSYLDDVNLDLRRWANALRGDKP